MRQWSLTDACRDPRSSPGRPGQLNAHPAKEFAMSLNPAMKRYNRRMIWLWLIYAAFLFVALYTFKHRLLGGPGTYLVAILPALPIIGSSSPSVAIWLRSRMNICGC
jgi:hypothetical protein